MKRIRITEDTLLNFGFVKRANVYTKGNNSIQLIKGHTWEYIKLGDKFGRSVKYIDEL